MLDKDNQTAKTPVGTLESIKNYIFGTSLEPSFEVILAAARTGNGVQFRLWSDAKYLLSPKGKDCKTLIQVLAEESNFAGANVYALYCPDASEQIKTALIEAAENGDFPFLHKLLETYHKIKHLLDIKLNEIPTLYQAIVEHVLCVERAPPWTSHYARHTKWTPWCDS